MILFLKGTNAKDVENAHVVSTPFSASTVSDSNATCSSTGSSVSEFSENLISLPIQRFSRAAKECLETKKRPTPKERREVVRVLCDELLDKRHPVQRKDIRFLAKLMVQHYPLSFEDRSLGGTKIEDGTFTLFAQMENRLYNMRRTSDVSTESCVDNEDVPLKRSRASWHGCSDTSTNKSTANELEVWRIDLIKNFEDQEKDETKIGSTLSKCFPAIQEFILQQRYSVQELKSNWPLLFTLSGSNYITKL